MIDAAEAEAARERLRLIGDSLPVLVSLLDRDERYLFVNATYQRWFGGEAASIVGRSLAEVVGPAAYQALAPHVKVVLSGRPVTFQTRACYMLGGPREIEATYTPHLVGGEVQGFVALVADVSERVQMQEQLQAAIAVRDEFLSRAELQLRALAGHLQTVREDERAELSREIHDVLGQELTGLKMDAAWLIRRLAPGQTAPREQLVARLEAMLAQMDASIVNARRIATRLRPGVLDDLGLVAALEWQCREFEQRSGIAVRWRGPREEPAIDQARATAVFRICQELLTNIARHAGGKSAQVEMAAQGDCLTLEVRDDGRGITPQEVWGTRSLGLLGIRERALAVGGDCLIEGIPGRGTCARLRVPLAR